MLQADGNDQWDFDERGSVSSSSAQLAFFAQDCGTKVSAYGRQ